MTITNEFAFPTNRIESRIKPFKTTTTTTTTNKTQTQTDKIDSSI